MGEGKETTIRAKLVRKRGGEPMELVFKTVPELFSYKQIDSGTAMLIEELDIKKADNCLDIGCGYGPVGIVMAKLAPEGKTYLVDRDFLCVEYSNKNIKENKISNAGSLLSNGFSNIGDKKFDVMASNLPGHVSHVALHNLISDMKAHFNSGGRIYVVIVSMFGYFIKREFKEVFGNCKTLRTGTKHTVFMAFKK